MERVGNRINIPFEWFKYHNACGYFITYYGDIYHGFLIEHPKYDDRFFILSKNQAIEFRDLKGEERTLENYQRLAWEIKDINIIKHILPDQHLGVEDNIIDTTRHGNHKWKRMFLFGAGASTHCLFGKEKKKEYTSMLRPPLGCDLFDKKYDEYLDKFEGAKLSVPIFEANGRDIEGGLEEEWIRLRNSYNPDITKRHINLQFYLQTLFHWISSDVVRDHYRNNLYSLFVSKLQSHISNTDERVALVSFNYDTILDQFVEKVFHKPFNTMKDYIDYNNQNVLLFKPHGSCNWGWPIKNRQNLNNPNTILSEALYESKIEMWDIYYRIIGDLNDMVHKSAWGMEADGHKHRLSKYTINKNRIEVNKSPLSGTHFPALLMPYRDKDEFVMHYDHHKAMGWFMNEMEELYLIGWKGNEDMFNRQLKLKANQLKKIVIVNPLERKNKEVSKNLSTHLDLKKVKIEIVDDFESFVLNEMDKVFTIP